MPHSKDQELAEVLTAVHRKAEQLLIANGIYDISNYGWLDHDTPDPEFFGHAIYQMQPPFECDWEAFLGGAMATYIPTDRDEALTLAGEDFVGTMAFARQSFGLALCYAQSADTNILTGEPMESYWQEYATTLHWLNVASDRIRDYFVTAQFGSNIGDYERAYRQRNENRQPKYSVPFQEAAKDKPGPSAASLGKLAGVAGRLQQNRTDRNAVVHRIASLTAKQSIEFLHYQRESARAALQPGTPTEVPLNFETTAELIESSVAQCKEWYIDLVRASSLVFEIEYFNRNPKP
jgi:hypothetical protein